MSVFEVETVQQPAVHSYDDVLAIESRPLRAWGLPRSTYDLLRRSVDRFGASPALTALGPGADLERARTLSYRELLTRTNRAARGFRKVADTLYPVVTSMLRNSIESTVTAFGAQAVGTFNPVASSLTAEEIAAVLTTARSHVLVAEGPSRSPGLWAKALAAARMAPCLRALVIVDDRPVHEIVLLQPSASGLPVLDYNELLDAQSAADLGAGPHGDDIAALMVVGVPREVVRLARQTHTNQVYSAWAMTLGVPWEPGQTMLAGMPLHRVNGLVVSVLAAAYTGTHVVSLGPLGFRDCAVTATFWDLVEHWRAGLFAATPNVIRTLADVPVRGRDISSLRYAACGNAPLRPSWAQRFEACCGVPVVEGYGLPEGTCLTAMTPLEADRPAGAVGLRLPYQEVRAVDARGRALPVGSLGRLQVRGPNVFTGYLRGETVGYPVTREGWLETGDRGTVFRGWVSLAGVGATMRTLVAVSGARSS